MNYPNGIQKMCGFIEGLVETSCNVGVTRLDEECLTCSTSVRSSAGSAKKALAGKIQYLTEFLGGEYHVEGDYPSWEYRQDSALRPLMVQVYKEMYRKEPAVQVIHAGLECGLLSAKKPTLDCVSFGPDISDVHSVKERLDIASTARVWEMIKNVLAKLK